MSCTQSLAASCVTLASWLIAVAVAVCTDYKVFVMSDGNNKVGHYANYVHRETSQGLELCLASLSYVVLVYLYYSTAADL